MNPNWTRTITKLWKNQGVPELSRQEFLLKRGICLLEKARPKLLKSPLGLLEQPFDLHLLSCSPLYRLSRKQYLSQGGTYLATLVSSPRTLSSAILLEQRIEYSPIERELVWAATDPIESKNPKNKLMELRTFASNLFHEQNHRILWKHLPGAPATKDGVRRYLNFAESLVIVLDMALSDHLGPQMASLFYLTGVIYDPGTTVWNELSNKRLYRNYLQACLYATYLYLEHFPTEDIPKVISALFPTLGDFAFRATERSLNLDHAFVHQTNPSWQNRQSHKLPKNLRSGRGIINLTGDPMDNRLQYLFAESWFNLMNL